MRTIWKYALAVPGTTNLHLPIGDDIEYLKFGFLDNRAFLWIAHFDFSDNKEEALFSTHAFDVVGTGGMILPKSNHQFIASAFLHPSNEVWHLFERMGVYKSV